MTTETVNIVVREDGSRVVKTNLEGVGTAAETAEKSVELLKGALEALAASEIVKFLVDQISQYQELRNELLSTTTSGANLNAVFNALTETANKTGTSIQQNVEAYQKLAIAGKSAGLSQQEVVTFIDQFTTAGKVAGVTSEGIAAGLNDVSRGFVTGRLEGVQLTRLLQQMPSIAGVLAAQLHVSTGALRDLADAGKISVQTVIDAFNKAGPALNDAFSKRMPSITEGFSTLKNEILLTINAVAGTGEGGLGGLLAKGLDTFSDTLKEITPDLILVRNAILGVLQPQQELSTGWQVFATILVVVFDTLKLVGQLLIGGIKDAFTTFGGLIGGMAASIKDFAVAIYDEFSAIVKAIEAVPLALADAARGDFAQAGKDVADAFGKPWQDGLDTEKRAANEFLDAVGDATDSIAKTADKQFNLVTTAAANTWLKIDAIWDKGARGIAAKPALAPTQGVSTVKGKNTNPEFSAAEIKATTDALRQLLVSFEPIDGEVLKLSQAEELLVKAQKEHIITSGQESQYLQDLLVHYRDILDPLGKYLRDLQQQTDLLKLDADQRAVESQVLQEVQDLTQKGFKLSDQEISNLRAKIQAYQDLNKVVTAQDALVAGSAAKQLEAQTTQLAAVKNLLADPKSNFNKTDAFNATTSANSDLFANSKEQLDAQDKQYAAMYANIDALRKQDVISEQTAQNAKLQIWLKTQAGQLATASTFFGNLATLQHSSNTKIAAIGKAAAITQATINTYQAATAAYASLAAIPYVGPALGAAAAAAAIVAGLANVAQIESASTGFMTGGSFTVPGGSGGPDSQTVAFRATPGEQVSIATPTQVRKGDPTGNGGGGQAAAPQVNQRIINVMDPGVVGDYLATPEGEGVLVNVLRRNSDVVRQIAGNA